MLLKIQVEIRWNFDKECCGIELVIYIVYIVLNGFVNNIQEN